MSTITERIAMPQSNQANETVSPPTAPSSRPRADEGNTADDETVSKPGGFKNDPDDANNPNEAIERHRRKLRP